MSFAVLVRDVLAESLPEIVEEDEVEATSQKVLSTLLDTLKDDAVRRETFAIAQEQLDIDMMQLHTILDALVKVVDEETVDA